jgi:hypothetical protein
MKRKYLYKNIVVYQYWGTWQADYDDGNGNRFPLHRWCCTTKVNAYNIAKKQVDWLNSVEEE